MMRRRGGHGRVGLLLVCSGLAAAVWLAPACSLDVSGQPAVAGASKLSPLLAGTLDRMTSAGVSRGTMGSHDLAQFSDPLVRVDQRGRLQVYIYLERLDPAALSELEAAGVAVELTNQDRHVVQGWVPFYLVEDVARLVNVTRIRPPDYAVPRSQKLNPREEGRTGGQSR